MKPHRLRTILIGLLLVSVGINVVQVRYISADKEHQLVNADRERLMRLSINRSLLVNSGCTLANASLQLIHGAIHMDLLRIQTRVRNLALLTKSGTRGSFPTLTSSEVNAQLLSSTRLW